MSFSSTADLLRRKRELHQRIARSRRRIDCRIHAVKDITRHVFDLRSHAARRPGWTLAAGLATSVAAAIALWASETVRRMGRSLLRQILTETKNGILSELHRFWTDGNEDDRTRSDD